MVLLWEPWDAGRGVGFAVGRTVGPAVVRSKVRRRLREGYRHLRESLKPAHMLFIARSASSSATTSDIGAEMRRLCHEAGLWHPPE